MRRGEHVVGGSEWKQELGSTRCRRHCYTDPDRLLVVDVIDALVVVAVAVLGEPQHPPLRPRSLLRNQETERGRAGLSWGGGDRPRGGRRRGGYAKGKGNLSGSVMQGGRDAHKEDFKFQQDGAVKFRNVHTGLRMAGVVRGRGAPGDGRGDRRTRERPHSATRRHPPAHAQGALGWRVRPTTGPGRLQVRRGGARTRTCSGRRRRPPRRNLRSAPTAPPRPPRAPFFPGRSGFRLGTGGSKRGGRARPGRVRPQKGQPAASIGATECSWHSSIPGAGIAVAPVCVGTGLYSNIVNTVRLPCSLL